MRRHRIGSSLILLWVAAFGGVAVRLPAQNGPPLKIHKIDVVPKQQPLSPDPAAVESAKKVKPQKEPQKESQKNRKESGGSSSDQSVRDASESSPPRLPDSAIPNADAAETEHAAAPPSDLAAQIMTKRFGTEQVQHMLDRFMQPGVGASSANVGFDQDRPLSNIGPDIPRGPQTDLFAGGGNTVVPLGHSNHPFTTVGDAAEIQRAVGGVSLPGGVVLQGQGDLGPIETIVYDSRFNALILDDRGAYFVKVSPHALIELSRALAREDQIGVSLGRNVQISYGALPKTSRVARDLMLTDHFLADIAFGTADWTAGYIFAGGYQPQRIRGSVRALVFFSFSDFKFEIDQYEIKATQESFDDRFIPVSNQPAPDGGMLPDNAAIEAGTVSPECDSNLRHIADNMDYYRHERIIERTFTYGETAAFLRGLKAQGVDLEELANAVETEYP